MYVSIHDPWNPIGHPWAFLVVDSWKWMPKHDRSFLQYCPR